MPSNGIPEPGFRVVASSRIRHRDEGRAQQRFPAVPNRCQSALVQRMYGLNKHRRGQTADDAGSTAEIRTPVAAGAPARRHQVDCSHVSDSTLRRKYQLFRRRYFAQRRPGSPGARGRCSAPPSPRPFRQSCSWCAGDFAHLAIDQIDRCQQGITLFGAATQVLATHAILTSRKFGFWSHLRHPQAFVDQSFRPRSRAAVIVSANDARPQPSPSGFSGLRSRRAVAQPEQMTCSILCSSAAVRHSWPHYSGRNTARSGP